MKRPKKFLVVVVLLSVVTIVLVAGSIHHAIRRSRPQIQTASSHAEELRPLPSPRGVTEATASPAVGTPPAAAAQKRAKEFNDAVNRFNAPDAQ